MNILENPRVDSNTSSPQGGVSSSLPLNQRSPIGVQRLHSFNMVTQEGIAHFYCIILVRLCSFRRWLCCVMSYMNSALVTCLGTVVLDVQAMVKSLAALEQNHLALGDAVPAEKAVEVSEAKDELEMMLQLSEYMDSLENKCAVLDAECDMLRTENEEVKADRDQLEKQLQELVS